jgi:hypothetical protein
MKINYTRPNTYSAAGVTLYPGINILPDDLATEFLQHPAVKARLQSGLIMVIAAEATEPTEQDVGSMADIAALRAMAKGNARNATVKAARARLAEIDAAAKAG